MQADFSKVAIGASGEDLRRQAARLGVARLRTSARMAAGNIHGGSFLQGTSLQFNRNNGKYQYLLFVSSAVPVRAHSVAK